MLSNLFIRLYNAGIGNGNSPYANKASLKSLILFIMWGHTVSADVAFLYAFKSIDII